MARTLSVGFCKYAVKLVNESVVNDRKYNVYRGNYKGNEYQIFPKTWIVWGRADVDPRKAIPKGIAKILILDRCPSCEEVPKQLAVTHEKGWCCESCGRPLGESWYRPHLRWTWKQSSDSP